MSGNFVFLFGSSSGNDCTFQAELKLRFRGDQVEAFIDGTSLAQKKHQRISGCVAFASSYDQNLFDDLEVTP